MTDEIEPLMRSRAVLDWIAWVEHCIEAHNPPDLPREVSTSLLCMTFGLGMTIDAAAKRWATFVGIPT